MGFSEMFLFSLESRQLLHTIPESVCQGHCIVLCLCMTGVCVSTATAGDTAGRMEGAASPRSAATGAAPSRLARRDTDIGRE